MKNSKLVSITVTLSVEQAAPFIRAANRHNTEPGNVLLAMATDALRSMPDADNNEIRELAANLWDSCVARVAGAPGWTKSDQFEKQPKKEPKLQAVA